MGAAFVGAALAATSMKRAIAAKAAPTKAAPTQAAPTVILLHGLMMRRPALVPMALRLRKRGFAPELFAYSSLWRDPEEAIARLVQRLEATVGSTTMESATMESATVGAALAATPSTTVALADIAAKAAPTDIAAKAAPTQVARTVHLVAHSLGGLVVLEALRRCPHLPIGRVVCIGSPITGSAAARGLVERGVGFATGRSGSLLRAGIGQLPPGRAVAMIAGSRPMGLGRLFGHFIEDNDGTVAVGETRLPGLEAHVVIRASHSGLIVSTEAAELAGRYLATGSFEPARL